MNLRFVSSVRFISFLYGTCSAFPEALFNQIAPIGSVIDTDAFKI
jgi:hypothetical protein